MVFAVMSCFVLAALAPGLQRLTRALTPWLLALLPAAIFTYFVMLIPVIQAQGSRLEVYPWVPGLAVNLTFYLDGLSLLFALLISGIGTLIVIYAGGYLAGHPQLGRFFLYLLFFMGSMLGVVLASNVITLFVFWELTSFSSYLLIGFLHESERSRKAALQALLVTGLGGLAMLAGLVLLALMGGSFELSELILQRDLSEGPLYLGALLLILAGAFTKSAQFPFHFWLPGAMAAPTPVSAYLHSATMVKAGVYLLARLNPALGGTDTWLWLVGGVGALTMLVGGLLALAHTDLKRLLAYTTMMALGTLTMLIGVGTKLAVEAMVVFLMVHALYKAALFMVAGAIDHETGTRDVTLLSGLGRKMPLTFVGALVAALSMAGLPPLFGFIGKEIIYEGALDFDTLPWLVAGTAVVANIAVVAVAGLVALKPFVGPLRATPKKPHEAPASMWLGPIVLGISSIVFGLLPALVGPTLLVGAASSVLGEPFGFELVLWHGVNAPLILSLITVTSGALVYILWRRVRPALGGFDRLFGEGPRGAYEGTLLGLDALAGWQTRTLQNGSLRRYLFLIVAATVILTGGTVVLKNGFGFGLSGAPVSYYEVVVALLCLAGSVSVVLARSRLAAVAALGLAGYSLALLFVLFSAPDLALTQLFVETLSVIILTLVVIYLPQLMRRDKMDDRGRPVVRDALFSVAAGALVTTLIWSVTSAPLDRSIPAFYEATSYLGAEGRNIVNVILVDFRALDTLGEILVLALAGVGVLTLMRLRSTTPRPPQVRGDGLPEHRASPELGTEELGIKEPGAEAADGAARGERGV
jgi:multicomponent Na+:H+ antiporter subunit A